MITDLTDGLDKAARPPTEAGLSAGQLGALRNLSRKSAHHEVAFINIADARALTEMGLAERNREGWLITDAGHSLLKASDVRAGETSPEPLVAYNGRRGDKSPS